MRSAHRSIWAGHCGEIGVTTTAEAASRQTSRDHAWHTPAGQWMYCMKLLSQRLAARNFDRQVAEAQLRIAVLNCYTALGIPVTKTVD